MANAQINNQVSRYLNAKLTKHDFPSDFLWGAATSHYQIDGAYTQDGKSLSNWDIWSLNKPEKIQGGTNGCVAIDHYNRYEDDVALMKKLGLNSYRFSLSWSRILPGGNLNAGVNRKGIEFYNKFIDLLIANGIEPCVTLFHFDFPQSLESEYGGFLSPRIVKDFGEYVDVCFFEFGDRVKYWITENEPFTFTAAGYMAGVFPPGHGTPAAQTTGQQPTRHRCPVDGVDQTCYGGDATTEPYIVAHHLILAHAKAVEIYRTRYQAVQGGKIGVTNMSTWYEPFTDSQDDIDAASRAVDFAWGWFVAPIVTGDYPPVMRERVGTRLPKFTPEQTAMVKGSYDFLGMNYYTTNWASNMIPTPGEQTSYFTDMGVVAHTDRDGVPIGKMAGSTWLFVVPRGIYGLLMHTKNKYNDPPIYITENGVDELNDPNLTVSQAIIDPERISYHVQHLAYVKLAMEHGARVKGYYPWSLLDNYEWASGYTVRFGFIYVDYANDLRRYPKDSAIWLMNFLNPTVLLKRQAEELEDTAIATAAAKKRKGR